MDRAATRTAGVIEHSQEEASAGVLPGLAVACRGTAWALLLGLVLAAATVIPGPASAAQEPEAERVCRPVLEKSPSITLSQTGLFRWNCSSQGKGGGGYYIVFVRPSGTYVLLKVPEGLTTFEFAPDVPGQWRWIVINTDPDRTKPDVESNPSSFEVTPMSEE